MQLGSGRDKPVAVRQVRQTATSATVRQKSATSATPQSRAIEHLQAHPEDRKLPVRELARKLNLSKDAVQRAKTNLGLNE